MDTETLFALGYLPLKYYNQLNGKSAQENYNKRKQQQKSALEEFVISTMQASLKAALATVFEELEIGAK